MLKGDSPLPWEGCISEQHRQQLGSLQEHVLNLLHRDPAQRSDMATFHRSCTKLFASRSVNT